MNSLQHVTFAVLLVLVQSASAEPGIPIRQSPPLQPHGPMLGTRGYAPLEDEVAFRKKVTEKPIDLWAEVKVPKPKNMSDEQWAKEQEKMAARKKEMIPVRDYEAGKQDGQYVAWFGIVRAQEYTAQTDKTRLLVEHKYFDGLTDLHLQIVSMCGAGDFQVSVPGKIGPDELPKLALLCVYGKVSVKDGNAAVIDAEYIRVWDWGLFAFMAYGPDKSNPDWVNLRKVTGDRAYDSQPANKYYEDRIGVRPSGAKN